MKKKVCRCQQKKKYPTWETQQRSVQKNKRVETDGSTGRGVRSSLTRAFPRLPACRRFYAEHDCPIPRPLPRLRAHARTGVMVMMFVRSLRMTGKR